MISVITVVLNDYPGLQRTYDSLVSQADDSQTRIEWIVVDGGSVDGSASFQPCPNVGLKYTIESKRDSGIFDAMNRGIRLAEGEYLNFLNAGDTYHSKTVISDVLKVIDDLNDQKIIAGKVQAYIGDRSWQITLAPWVCHQTAFIPSEFFKERQYKENLRFYGDLEFWMWLNARGQFNLVRLDTTIAKFELGGVGNHPKYTFARLKERNSLEGGHGDMKRKFARHVFFSFSYLVWKVFGLKNYFSFTLKFSRD